MDEHISVKLARIKRLSEEAGWFPEKVRVQDATKPDMIHYHGCCNGCGNWFQSQDVEEIIDTKFIFCKACLVSMARLYLGVAE